MPTYSESFRADVRSAEDARDIEAGPWFAWRTRTQIELGPLDTARFVENTLRGERLRVADVGCGNGYLALELARAGHSVTGIDPSEEALSVARRTAAGEALDLVYLTSTFEAFEAPDESYDAIVFNLSLHHMGHLAAAVTKARRLLRPGGRVVCHEFAYDRLDEATATWLFQTQEQLRLSGLAADEPGEGANEAEAIDALRSGWTTRYAEHELHGFEAMRKELEATFHREHFAWAPYLFVLVGSRIQGAPAAREAALLRFFKGMESHLIETGRIQSVAFRFVGAR